MIAKQEKRENDREHSGEHVKVTNYEANLKEAHERVPNNNIKHHYSLKRNETKRKEKENER